MRNKCCAACHIYELWQYRCFGAKTICAVMAYALLCSATIGDLSLWCHSLCTTVYSAHNTQHTYKQIGSTCAIVHTPFLLFFFFLLLFLYSILFLFSFMWPTSLNHITNHNNNGAKRHKCGQIVWHIYSRTVAVLSETLQTLTPINKLDINNKHNNME